MRISTRTFLEQPVTDMTRLQATLGVTQQEIASGVRQSASEPATASRLGALDRSVARLAQYERNAAFVGDRLRSTETAIADAGDVLQRIHELAVQAGSGTLDGASRKLIAAEVRSLRDHLLGVANRIDPNGGYLFGGSRSEQAPFVEHWGIVQYQGDEALRAVEVLPGRAIADGVDGGSFAEIQAEGETRDVFAAIDGFASALESVADGSLSEQDFYASIADTLTISNAGIDHYVLLRARIGGRLATLDSCLSTRANIHADLLAQASQLRDLDMAEAISRLQAQLTGLQAAQLSYTKLARLSLFDYF